MESDKKQSRKPRKPNPIDVHVGSKVKLRRMLLGLSQENLGDRIGLTFQQIQKYEKGTNRIGASRLFELANVLGVSVQFFYDGAPVPEIISSVPGFAEDTTSDHIESFMTSCESIELNRAFANISAPRLRRSIVELVRTIADCGDSEKETE